MTLLFDYNYMINKILGEKWGITEGEIEKYLNVAEEASIQLWEDRKKGLLSFMDFRELESHVPEIKKHAGYVKERFRTLVVFGIGGSALGAQAIKTALSHRTDHKGIEVIVADNIDPRQMKTLTDRLDYEKTVFNVISKSGETMETLAQFMIIREFLIRKVGVDGFRERMIFTTDPQKGILREMARDENIRSLCIPPQIGGRFSVLTPVGLFPAEVMGLDSQKLLGGAKKSDSPVHEVEWDRYPPYMYAFLSYIAAVEKKMNISVLMPYSVSLRDFAFWFSQLWAESLGKIRQIDGEHINLGQTPVVSIGVTDQHSQLQLFIEGPRDKIITFLAIDDFECDIEIPTIDDIRRSLGSLSGKSLFSLFDAERKATEAALAIQGRMSMTIHLPHLSEETLGALFYFFEMATTFCGYLYKINPFNQPGVEEGKNYTWAMMGRSGFDESRKRFENRPRKSDKYRCEI